MSDVDLLVDLDPEHHLKGFAYFSSLDELRSDLEALLDCRVDIIDAGSLRPRPGESRSRALFRDAVHRDAVAL